MQHDKRGNPRRCKRRRKVYPRPVEEQPRAVARRATVPSIERVRLSLHAIDPVTGDEDILSSLFYECYRGYTLYSTAEGKCALHGRHGGCLRLEGQYVCFPAIEEAKQMVKYFQATGHLSWASMERQVPEDVYVCLNRSRQQRQTSRAQYRLVG